MEDPEVRRVVLRADVQSYDDQVPAEGSALGKVLKTVYDRYDGNVRTPSKRLRLTSLSSSWPPTAWRIQEVG